MPLTPLQLSQTCPHCAQPDAWAAALNPALEEFGVTTPARTAAFLGQIAHESGELNHIEENFNYSADRLVQVFPRLFPSAAAAAPFVGNKEKLASFLYANRIGNGTADSGDGWKYRGRGLIQLTGRANYREAGQGLGVPLEDQPDLLLQPAQAARSAGFFWKSRGLNELADMNTDDAFVRITGKINGAEDGLARRRTYWAAAKHALGIA
jgi:putative chitinase